jgi:hypothetical protein
MQKNALPPTAIFKIMNDHNIDIGFEQPEEMLNVKQHSPSSSNRSTVELSV